MKVGYIRVSTQEANLAVQEATMARLGVERVFIDRVPGVGAKPQLEALVATVGTGDVVVVHSLCRLSRDVSELRQLLDTLNQKGVTVESHEN